MNIRKFWRLCCLTVASFFWASCSESNPQFPMAQAANPDSSTDANGGGLGDESSSSAVAPESSSANFFESSSSEIAPQSSSSDAPASSSSAVESSSSEIGSSSSAEFVLARDPSVTCDTVQTIVSNPNCNRSPGSDCDDYKKFLGSDTTISEKILNIWEKTLESCEAIPEMSSVVYGIEPTTSCLSFYPVTYYKCSNDSMYEYINCWLEDNLIYTNTREYNEAHGISSNSAPESSSSAPESSSSAEDLVKSCAQGDFALFVDILADVQTALYEKFSKQLEESSLSEKGKLYLEGLLDYEKKALKTRFAPYMLRGYYDDSNSYGLEMSRETNLWFNGYIAKTKTCEDGTPVITERYQQKYDAILAECIEIIENEVKAASAEE